MSLESWVIEKECGIFEWDIWSIYYEYSRWYLHIFLDNNKRTVQFKSTNKKVQNRNSCTTITDISPIILSSRKTKARGRSQLSNRLQWLVLHSTSVFRQTFASKFLDIYMLWASFSNSGKLSFVIIMIMRTGWFSIYFTNNIVVEDKSVRCLSLPSVVGK